MSDSVRLAKTKDYVNFREFKKKAKKKWGMSKEEIATYWKSLLSDTAVPKSKDQMGWLTMPALSKFKLNS